MPINDQVRDSVSPINLVGQTTTVETSGQPISVLTINFGSPSIRFALFKEGDSLRHCLADHAHFRYQADLQL